MTNLELAHRFDETADLLELQEANPFRIRAYRNAARNLSDLTQSVADLAVSSPQGLTALPGVGKDIAAKIIQIVESGTFPLLEELRHQFPPGLLLLLHLPSVGPKKAAILFRELKIDSPEALKAAAEAGKIADLKGFGKKSQQAMLEGLAQLEQGGRRALLSDATTLCEAILSDLRTVEGVGQASIAGSCRRRKDSCGDLDLLITSTQPEAAMDRLAGHPLVDSMLSRGRTKQRVRLKNGIELDLRVVPEESFGAALQYFTGSKEHNIVIRQRGIDRDLKINEYGVFRGEELVAGETEEDVYAAVGLPWIPPELRENRGEIERAERGTLPRLIAFEDIRGDLHMHTTASDGKASIREMIEAARERGLKYIAITDHSKRVSMANGLTPERLRQHWKEIRKIRDEYDDIDVMLGIECDILEQAELDLPDDVLREADWVLAVLHYGLRQPREQIMARLLTAIRNPYVCAIGHPSGRMIGRRPGADIDYPVFFQAAADHGVMLEINAHPNRLDLDDIHAAAAQDYGIPIVIDTDAHSTTGLDVMHFGIDQARRAGLRKEDVANTRTFRQFQRLLRTKR
jgi:DNA polymerase (family 10)